MRVWIAAIFVLALSSIQISEAKEVGCDVLSTAIATTPVPPQFPLSLKISHDITEKIPSDADLILIGDSQIDNWRKFQSEDLPSYKIYNFGVPQDRTQNVLWRMNNVGLESMVPKQIVIMIGTNNLSDGLEGCAIGAAIEKIAYKARKLWPQSSIAILSIPPRGADFKQYDDRRIEANKRIEDFVVRSAEYRFVRIDDREFTCNNYQRGELPSNTMACFPSSAYICKNYDEDHFHLSRYGYRAIAVLLNDLQHNR